MRSSNRGSGWAPNDPVSRPWECQATQSRRALKRRRSRTGHAGGWHFSPCCAAVSADSNSETRFSSLSRPATSSRIMLVMLVASARYSSSSATMPSASAAGSWLCAGASSRLGGLGGGGSAPRPRPRDDAPRPRLPRPFDPPSTIANTNAARAAADSAAARAAIRGGDISGSTTRVRRSVTHAGPLVCACVRDRAEILRRVRQLARYKHTHYTLALRTAH